MAYQVEDTDVQTLYRTLLRLVCAEGGTVAPRGVSTREVEDVTCVLPPDVDGPGPVRPGFNSALAATELVQILAGVSCLEQLDRVSGARFHVYADDGRLCGAYGPRLADQLARVVEQLDSDDAGTRQAVAVLWDPARDPDGSRDVPCTLALTFRRRRCALNMSVHMRSNDLWRGVPYDWYVFARLHRVLARVLHLDVGTYVHHMDSLHLYGSDLEDARSLARRTNWQLRARRRRITALPWFTPDAAGRPELPMRSWRDVQQLATRVLWPGDDDRADNGFFPWRVPPLSAAVAACPTCRYVVPRAELEGTLHVCCAWCYQQLVKSA